MSTSPLVSLSFLDCDDPPSHKLGRKSCMHGGSVLWIWVKSTTCSYHHFAFVFFPSSSFFFFFLITFPSSQLRIWILEIVTLKLITHGLILSFAFALHSPLFWLAIVGYICNFSYNDWPIFGIWIISLVGLAHAKYLHSLSSRYDWPLLGIYFLDWLSLTFRSSSLFYGVWRAFTLIWDPHVNY